jgi:hypothetical protein
MISLFLDRFDDPIPEDPFQSAGFITAFSQISVQQLGAFTLTARTFPGELADLERVLTDFNLESAEGSMPVLSTFCSLCSH